MKHTHSLYILTIFCLVHQVCLSAKDNDVRFDKLWEYESVKAATFCSDGHICVSMRDGTLNVCNLDNGHTVMSNRNAVFNYVIDWSSVEVCDTRTGGKWKVFGDAIRATFSRDYEYIIISEFDTKSVNYISSLYKSSTGECLGVMPYYDDVYIYDIYVYNDTVLCRIENALLIWNVAESICNSIPMQNEFNICNAVFRPDEGEILLFKGDGSIFKLDTYTLQLQKCDFSFGVGLIDIAYADIGYWATLSDEGAVEIWREDTMSLLVRDTISGFCPIKLKFLPGADMVKVDMHNQSSYLIGIDGNKQYILNWYDSYFLKAAGSGDKVLLASYDSTYLLDFQGKYMVQSGMYEYSIDAYVEDFSSTGENFLTISENGKLCIYNTVISNSMTLPKRYTARVTAATFSSDGKRVIVALDDCRFLQWDLRTNKITVLPLQLESVYRISVSPDGRYMMVLSADGVKIYDFNSCEIVNTSISHDGRINAAVFSPDGRYVLTASQDYTARIWSVENDYALVEVLNHEGPVNAVEFSSDGLYFSTLDFFGTCSIFKIGVADDKGKVVE